LFSTLHLYLADGSKDAFEYRGQVQVYEDREATQTELNEARIEIGRRVCRILYLIPVEEHAPRPDQRGADFLQHWAKTAPHEWEHKVNYLYQRIRHQIIKRCILR
jgi:hypothetical protein